MKRLIIIVGSLLLLLLAVSLLLPTRVSVSKAIDISASGADIEPLLRDFSKWNTWYPPLVDRRLKMQTISDDSRSATLIQGGGRRLKLYRTVSDTGHIQIDFDTNSRTKLAYEFFWRTVPPGGIKLVLTVHTRLGGYPWERAKGIFVEKILGPQTEQILKKIKLAAEQNG